MSGAILSRNHKSKVLALSSWAGKSDLPLSLLKTFLRSRFLVSRYVPLFGKFEDAVISWGSRVLDSLSQIIEVLEVFALSRLRIVNLLNIHLLVSKINVKINV